MTGVSEQPVYQASFEPLEPRLLLDGDADLLPGIPMDSPAVENLVVPCDSNLDGLVDGGDLSVWQLNYDPIAVSSHTLFDGDWNADGKVDGADLALWQSNYSPTASSPASEYAQFNQFCIDSFGAENEPLVYDKFGFELEFVESGAWRHVSVQSASVAFETNLPATAYVAYGETTDYGRMTALDERPFYLHLAYLRNLQPETEYHYQIVMMDERGNVVTGGDATFVTGSFANVITIDVAHLTLPYNLEQAGATYVLSTDVVADSTAFSIMASNVVLDLNGHTVTYDNVAGAYDPTATSAYFPNWMLNGPHGVRRGFGSYNSRIFNGTVLQGEGGAGNGANALCTWEMAETAGVTVAYHGPQLTGPYGDLGEFHHNVVIDLGTVITDRHNGTTALQVSEDTPRHHNLIKRARQRGIKVYDNDEVYRNEVYIDSWATNSFGIMSHHMSNASIHHNWVFGGGYHPIGIGTTGSASENNEVYENLIHMQATQPTLRSDEYGAMSRVNAMRITWGGDNTRYHDNLMVVYARDGGSARGIWYSTSASIGGVVFEDNIIKAVVEDPSDGNGAVCINGYAPSNSLSVTITHNRIISNFCNVRLADDYGGGSNALFIENTFVRIGDRADYRLIGIGYDWQTAVGHRFIDNEFEGGASYDDVVFVDNGPRDFTVEWTLTVNTAAFANMTIEDAFGVEVFSGQADASGTVSVVLVEYLEESSGRTYSTPHTVTVDLAGQSDWTTVTMDATKSITLIPPAGFAGMEPSDEFALTQVR